MSFVRSGLRSSYVQFSIRESAVYPGLLCIGSRTLLISGFESALLWSDLEPARLWSQPHPDHRSWDAPRNSSRSAAVSGPFQLICCPLSLRPHLIRDAPPPRQSVRGDDRVITAGLGGIRDRRWPFAADLRPLLSPRSPAGSDASASHAAARRRQKLDRGAPLPY